MLSYGLPAALSLIPQTLNLRMDQMLMAAFLAPANLGQYVVAVSWSAAASPIINAVGPVLFPSMSALSNPTKKTTLLKAVLPRFLILASAATFIIAILTPFMIPLLFGEEFRPAILPAIVLVFANTFLSSNSLCSDALKGMGDTRKILAADLTGLGVTVVLLLTFIPRFGIMGAALASLAAYFCVSILLAYFIWSHYHNLPVEK